MKLDMVNKYKKGSVDTPFFQLLPGSKQRRIAEYKAMPKVDAWLKSGKEVAS